MSRLLTLDEAAADLGVPRASLRVAAERHGYLVRMGRALRIDPNDIPELVEKCREPQKAPASTAGPTTAATSSATTAGQSQQALEIAETLKRRSRAISPQRAGPKADVIRLK